MTAIHKTHVWRHQMLAELVKNGCSPTAKPLSVQAECILVGDGGDDGECCRIAFPVPWDFSDTLDVAVGEHWAFDRVLPYFQGIRYPKRYFRFVVLFQDVALVFLASKKETLCKVHRWPEPEQEPYPVLQLRPPFTWHGEQGIVGNRAAIAALWDACERALEGGQAIFYAHPGDWETAEAQARRQQLRSYQLKPGQRVAYTPNFLYGAALFVHKVSPREILVTTKDGEVLIFCGSDTQTPGYWRAHTCVGKVLTSVSQYPLRPIEAAE